MTKKKYPGYLLLANPNNPRDELSKSVLLIVTHTNNIAIGLRLPALHELAMYFS